MIATTPNCGVCANCLAGRGDLCNTRLPAIPNATMADKTPVYMTAPPMGPASYGELDRLRRRLDRAAVHDGVTGRVVSAGLRRWNGPRPRDVPLPHRGRRRRRNLRPRSHRYQCRAGRAHPGCQDNHRSRARSSTARDLALKLGATHVFDPNVDKGNDLLAEDPRADGRSWTAGRRYAGERQAGPTSALEAVGGTRRPLPPNIEAPSDLTGIEPLQQALRPSFATAATSARAASAIRRART